MAGMRKKLTRSSVPLIAWCFNIGACYGGWKQLVAKQALQGIDRFIVHSRHECQILSQWLNLPLERFQFVPLQRAPIPITETEEQETPFLLALGSANRDYKTFFAAVAQLNLRTIVVASHHAVRGLEIPPNVELYSGLNPQDCHHLAQRARITVVPLELTQTASGQVTVIESMRMARPVIATRCPGTIDYIQPDQTGLLVQPYSVQDLSDTIARLWSDADLRAHLSSTASTYAETHLSDPAAGAALKQVLDQFV